MSAKNKHWWAGKHWAIQPEAAHRLGTMAGPENALAPDARPERYDVIGSGTAVIHLQGMLGTGWFGTDYDSFRATLAAAEADPTVDDITISVDSPGGFISGVHEAARALKSVNKPTLAMVGGMCCSAAYWIASACDRIESSPTGIVGCIGALVTLYAPPEGPDSPVVKLVSSQTPNKNPNPKTDEGRSQYQAILDEQADVFLNDVADFRGISYSEVSTRYGQGAMFSARAALVAGMIDSITGAVPETEANMADASTDAQVEPAAETDAGEGEKTEREIELEEKLKKAEDALKELEDKAGKLESEEPEGEAEAEPAAVEGEDDEEMVEDGELVAMRAQLDAANAKAKATALDSLIKAGLMAPAERAVAAVVYDSDPALYKATYEDRTEPVVDLGAVAAAGTPPKESPPDDPKERIIYDAKAYCAEHKIDPKGPKYMAVISGIENGNITI